MVVIQKLSDKEKWNIIKNCDANYDYVFYYGVKTTGIFCRPSCRAKTPLFENVWFMNTVDEAIKAGFRPCKRCRPDESSYQPDLELVNEVKEKIEASLENQIDTREIAKELGVSSNHLTRLFKHYTGEAPHQYLIKRRLEKASEMLINTDDRIVDIVYEVGFKSISNFYKAFNNQYKDSPKDYRIKHKLKRPDN